MPTYEYLCQSCSHRFETWQKMTDEPLTVCPECGAHIRRVLFPAGVVFKGSGFYKTDHASSTPKNEEGKESNKSATSTGETKTTAESKPTENSSSSSTTTESKAPAGTGNKVA